MTFVQNLEAKFEHLKTTAEGDLHALVLKLEAVFNRVHVAQVSSVLKQSVSSDIHDALDHVASVADTVRTDADAAVKVVDSADNAVEAVAGRTTSRRR